MQSLISESLDENIPVEEAHKQIDKVIGKYQNSILALKSQRNRYAPISRLPPEILCRIFSFTKTRDSGNYYYGHSFNLNLKWIKQTTHVTRHWRNIAVNSPSLWVDLPIGNSLWLEEMIKRSKNASIVIDRDLGSSYNITPGLESALKHGGRAKDISLRNLTSNVWNNLRKLFPESTPRLEYLTLGGTPPLYSTFGGDGSKSISIDSHMLCETGRLRLLELTNCTINWSSHSHLLRALVHLKLHNLPLNSRPTGQQFVDVLKSTPDLEYLDLQDVLPVHTTGKQAWPSDRVHLASLQTLNIRSTNYELDDFFSCVTFPPTATVKVVCCVTDTLAELVNSTDFSGFISNFTRSYSNHHAPIYNTIFLRRDDANPSGVNLTFYSDALSYDQMLRNNSKTRLELNFLWRSLSSSEPLVTRLIPEIFNSSLNLQGIEQIHMSTGIYGLSSEIMAITLGALPAVRSVTACEDVCGSFVDALKVRSDPKGAQPTAASTMYFPRLSCIFLLDAEFDVMESGLTCSGLRDCLTQRTEAGMKINKLILRSCRRLTEDDVAVLEEVVDDIDWDEEVMFTESEDDEDHEHDEYCDSYDEYDDDGYFYGHPYVTDFW